MALDVNSGEYKSIVGLKDLYIALVTADSAAAYTAGTPEILAPAAEATADPQVSLDKQHADDQIFELIHTENETVLNLTVTAMPLAMQALLTGRVFDSTTGRMYDNAAEPPLVALGFRSLKSNGSYRYFWFLKGKFTTPKDAMKTVGDKKEPQPVQISYTAYKTLYAFDLGDINDGCKRVVGDTDADNFSATTWFSQVQVPSVASVSALALNGAVDPADGASSVAVTKTITITFNNALQADAITNVIVAKADGTFVASTNTLDATKKVLTVNPDASLDASSTYIVTYGVTDIYGQTLKGAVNFATAS